MAGKNGNASNTDKEEKQVPAENTTGSLSNFDFGSFADLASDTGTTGLEALDATDLKLPKYKIVQITSEEFTRDGIMPGKFYNVLTKEVKDSVNCILLALGKSRVMWPQPFNRGDKPQCRSFDGAKKTEGCGEGVCATCKFSQWPKDDAAAGDKKKDNKPACTMGYLWLGVDDQDSVFRIAAQGSSVKPTKEFLNTIAPKLIRGSKKLGIFIFKIQLTTEKITDAKGTYYILKYNPVGIIDPADYEGLQAMSESYHALFMQALKQDTESVDTEEYGDEAPDNVSSGEGTGEKKAGSLF
jgi:hypothetical protein